MSHKFNGISQIQTRDLLGQFNYDLHLASGDRSSTSAVAIFYGDNGSGKTTILNLIFHLLSPARNKGHRTAISQIPFREFTIVFTNGMRVTLARDLPVSKRSYSIEIRWSDGTVKSLGFDAQEQSRYVPEEAESSFFDFLDSVHLSLYFLSADREIASDAWDDSEELDEWSVQMELFEAQRVSRRYRRSSARKGFRKTSLKNSLEMATAWIRRQALQGTNRGADSANTIYTSIVHKLARDPKGDRVSRGNIVKTLRHLEQRYRDFTRFKFTSTLDVEELISLVTQSSETRAEIIADVLEPYVDSLRARLDALQEIQRLTATFVDRVNSFYSGKQLAFDVTEGFAIYGKDKHRLDPDWLSSGERQLLMLLCHTLLSRDTPSIFIIDEPELSLNVKWQRKLIEVLLEIVEGGGTQFLFATHSFELLAQHQERVVRLEERAVESQ